MVTSLGLPVFFDVDIARLSALVDGESSSA
jgi:hypothetical protein